MATRPKSIGAMADAIFDQREKKRELEAQIKAIDDKIDLMSAELMERMDKEETDKASGTRCSVSIGSSVVANVVDWDALHAYIAKTKYFHLLQRRVADTSYRELLEAGKKIPGTQPFTKRRLNVRVLS